MWDRTEERYKMIEFPQLLPCVARKIRSWCGSSKPFYRLCPQLYPKNSFITLLHDKYNVGSFVKRKLNKNKIESCIIFQFDQIINLLLCYELTVMVSLGSIVRSWEDRRQTLMKQMTPSGYVREVSALEQWAILPPNKLSGNFVAMASRASVSRSINSVRAGLGNVELNLLNLFAKYSTLSDLFNGRNENWNNGGSFGLIQWNVKRSKNRH